MPDLLLELFSEEIPARMQAGAARDLERLVVGALSDRGLLFEGIKAFAGPRRLTLAISGLPVKQADVREEIKGPKLDAPQAALDGFLKKTGLAKDQLKVEKQAKGEVYIAVIEREGRETAAVLAEILPEVMAKLPWPKSMRWKPGVATRWVRPLHAILCTFDGEVVSFSFAGVSSGRHTRGHRFLSSGSIEVRRFDDYAAALKKAHVVLEAEERAAIIFEGVKQAAFIHGLELIPDEGLLAEVSGLAEWPVVLIGCIEDRFMDVPAEILQTSMRTHQKYFALRDPKTGKMANRFALVANMVAEDGGQEIVAGNERVLRARLSDAKFFWDEDRKRRLDSRIDDLNGIIFHAEIGTQLERSERVAILAAEIANKIGTDSSKAERAARLAKADLTTGVVGEFPELQGMMGRYYAINDGEDAGVASAIRDHYRPVGPSDTVPHELLSIAVAIADKLDLLVGFFAIGQKPTGSGDPFALRRAALGIIRICLENKLRLSLAPLAVIAGRLVMSSMMTRVRTGVMRKMPFWDEFKDDSPLRKLFDVTGELTGLLASERLDTVPPQQWEIARTDDLLSFFADRLKVALREQGIRHDLIDAVFALGGENDLVRLVARVEALQAFLNTEDGANLLAGYKRAANILKAEEKKDGRSFTGAPSEAKLTDPAEKALFSALKETKILITSSLAREDFAAAMRQMAALRVPVDGFFEAVKVNAEDAEVRENRLHLLASLREAVHRIGDFSRIEGSSG
ncbi:MAG: glycine--tRNA ligase subunit beta [Alphaproteobacteria bacterium]|nr:glycine--tRNA ligase subunit beta [Alphaproteobacteria bacterium]